jgi:hypothetical protein
MDRDKMSNVYREPSIDASYQVSVHMAEGFQRRKLKCEKLTTTDDGRQVMAKVHAAFWQGELKRKFIFLIPSLYQYNIHFFYIPC